MAQQAITIKFRTPTATRGARVSASSPAGAREYAYAHELTTEENAHAAARSFIEDMGWNEEFVIGSTGDASYVAVMLPTRFAKARDAVIKVRKAMSQGDLHGNPHCKQWGQAITDLTDGIQKDGFAAEYLRSL